MIAIDALMPSRFVPRLDPEALRLARRLRVTLVVGEDVPFCGSNVSLCEALERQQIACHLHVWRGRAHRFRHRRQMARVYIAGAAVRPSAWEATTGAFSGSA
jgi:esterase/lipase superfamily enzyme